MLNDVMCIIMWYYIKVKICVSWNEFCNVTNLYDLLTVFIFVKWSTLIFFPTWNKYKPNEDHNSDRLSIYCTIIIIITHINGTVVTLNTPHPHSSLFFAREKIIHYTIRIHPIIIIIEIIFDAPEKMVYFTKIFLHTIMIDPLPSRLLLVFNVWHGDGIGMEGGAIDDDTDDTDKFGLKLLKENPSGEIDSLFSWRSCIRLSWNSDQ